MSSSINRIFDKNVSAGFSPWSPTIWPNPFRYEAVLVYLK